MMDTARGPVLKFMDEALSPGQPGAIALLYYSLSSNQKQDYTILYLWVEIQTGLEGVALSSTDQA